MIRREGEQTVMVTGQSYSSEHLRQEALRRTRCAIVFGALAAAVLVMVVLNINTGSVRIPVLRRTNRLLRCDYRTTDSGFPDLYNIHNKYRRRLHNRLCPRYNRNKIRNAIRSTTYNLYTFRSCGRNFPDN